MRTELRKLSLLGIVGLVILTLSIPSFAGSQTGYLGTISGGGINFATTLIVNTTNNTYTVDFSGLNTNTTASTLNYFALQLFCCGSSASFDVTSYSMPSNWTAAAGACRISGGTVGWMCPTALGLPDALLIPAGKKFDMTFAGTFSGNTSVTSMFDLMANGLTDSSDGHSKWAISKGFAWQQFTPVPEPSAPMVLGSGLLLMAGFLRKKLFQ